MALLAASGLAAASFLSFPVAAFLSLGVLTLALSSGTMANAVSEGTVDGLQFGDATGWATRLWTIVAIPVFRVVLDVINLAKDFSPIDSLSTGRSITWGELGLAFGQIVVLLGGISGCSASSSSPAANWPPRKAPMSGRLRRFCCWCSRRVLLVGAACVQQSLNRDRDRLDLTRVQQLENAPPVLAFTTVALGGFRGLISNALWMRASDLQDEDKFFEMAQLADWITKLEPHFVHVWLVQAWNMAYNISVKFKDRPAISRPLALGEGRHRTAARRRPALQPQRDPDLPRAGVVLPAQDRPEPRRREHRITSSSGPRRWRRYSTRRRPIWRS